MNNPAVFVCFYESNKRKYGGWIPRDTLRHGNCLEGHVVEFIDLWGIQYTGLQVRKTPEYGLFTSDL